MNSLRQFILATIFTIAAAVTLSVQAADLIAIIASDTLDKDIGKSVKLDFDHMRKAMQTVANYTGLNLKEVLMEGQSTNPQQFLQQLNSIRAGSDDVVVFYFGGHGYRTKSKGDSPWPNLIFTQQDQGLEYDYVIYNLMEKHPRLLITIADVCNSFIGERSAPPLVNRAYAAAIPDEKIRANYQHLFLDEAGMINITSSQVGETSSGNNTEGGAFTSAFLQNLSDEVKNADDASWELLLERTKTKVAIDSKKHNQSKQESQHPYYEINTKNS